MMVSPYYSICSSQNSSSDRVQFAGFNLGCIDEQEDVYESFESEDNIRYTTVSSARTMDLSDFERCCYDLEYCFGFFTSDASKIVILPSFPPFSSLFH